MKLKPGVRLRGLRPEVACAIIVCNSVYGRVSQGGEFILTSVCDGLHSERASLHYAAAAFDFRIHDLPDLATKTTLHAEIADALGADFDVILEAPGTDNEHIHVEYQPKSV